MKNNIIITISGTGGSGKSTVAEIVQKKLSSEGGSAPGGKAKRIYVGKIWRDLAKKKKMTLDQWNEYALTSPKADLEVDNTAAKEARRLAKKNPVVAEGRVMFHFIPESFKVFITVDPQEGAKRIWKDLQNQKLKKKRNEGKINSYQDCLKDLKKRIATDKKRYEKLYGINYLAKKNYDLVIDTTNITAREAADILLEELNSKQQITNYK